jgi:hypothetical protein
MHRFKLENLTNQMKIFIKRKKPLENNIVTSRLKNICCIYIKENINLRGQTLKIKEKKVKDMRFVQFERNASFKKCFLRLKIILFYSIIIRRNY